MKYMRVGAPGQEKPVAVGPSNVKRDLSTVVPDIYGPNLAVLQTLTVDDNEQLPALDSQNDRIGACLASVPNIIAIGLNYRKHALETNNPIPKEPVVFSKHTSCITGPFDRVCIPSGAVRTDWEVELGVIIGRETYNVSKEDAPNHIFGYCTVNDISERDFQLNRGGQWLKGKSNPGFAPIGPWLVTADELRDPQNLSLRLWKNGSIQQDSTTADMIFPVKEIVSYLSTFMRLLPGDLIITGTPEGIGSRKNPPNFLRNGDLIEVEVEGLGRQRTTFTS